MFILSEGLSWKSSRGEWDVLRWPAAGGLLQIKFRSLNEQTNNPQGQESGRATNPRWSRGQSCSKEWITFPSVDQHRIQCVREWVDGVRGGWWKLFMVRSLNPAGTLPMSALLQSLTTASLPMSKCWHWQWSQPRRVLWDSVELRLWCPLSHWRCSTPEPCLPCFWVVCPQWLPITVPGPLTIEFVLYLT